MTNRDKECTVKNFVSAEKIGKAWPQDRDETELIRSAGGDIHGNRTILPTC